MEIFLVVLGTVFYLLLYEVFQQSWDIFESLFVCPSLAGTFDRQLFRRSNCQNPLWFSCSWRGLLLSVFITRHSTWMHRCNFFSLILFFLHSSSLTLFSLQKVKLFIFCCCVFLFCFLAEGNVAQRQKMLKQWGYLYYLLPLWRGNCIATLFKNKNYITHLRFAVTLCTRCQYWPSGALSKTNTWFDSLMLLLSKE